MLAAAAAASGVSCGDKVQDKDKDKVGKRTGIEEHWKIITKKWGYPRRRQRTVAGRRRGKRKAKTKGKGKGKRKGKDIRV